MAYTYRDLKRAWRYEKEFVGFITEFIKKNEVNADSAAVLAKLLQEKMDVIRSLEDSLRKAYNPSHSSITYYLYFKKNLGSYCSAEPEIQSHVEWGSALLKLNRIANPMKLSEEAGQNQSVAELDGIKKTLQELNEKMEICMASVLKGRPQVAVSGEDASDDESVDLMRKAVRKIEKLAAEQEIIKKTLQDLIEKTGAGTVAGVQKKPVVDKEKVFTRLITDLLQDLVSNTDKKEEEGKKNMKSLAEFKVKTLLEELKTIQTAELKDVEQKEDNKDGEV